MTTTIPLIPGWTSKPFPGISVSAGGLLALANLQTIAKRTAITGGASWADVFVLAPGLHHQQAAGDLIQKGTGVTRVVDQHGNEGTVKLNNAATAGYIHSVAKPGEEVILDINRQAPMRHSVLNLSNLLYLTTLLLTFITIAIIILFRDWWCLSFIFLYMTSRFINIWIIKRRTAPPRDDHHDNDDINPSKSHSHSSSTSTSSSSSSRHRSRSRFSRSAQRAAMYIISLGDATAAVRLRGKLSDLKAVTSDAWLRNKTDVEGYLEAAATLIVWVVAALSGNMTQVGNLAVMVLMILSAGLLAVSNSRAAGVMVNGRLAKVKREGDVEQGEEKGDPKGSGSATSLESSLGGGGGVERRGRRDEYRPATAAEDSRVGEHGAGRAGTFGKPVVGAASNPVNSAGAGEVGHVRWEQRVERPGHQA
ncbi:hypothetical protein QBC40DRAFT_314047 [Triangularia verruculosa]|uniref:Uncharacterized protein n=1 Tax=Triangularia verruculosa TaxID=2587418 RepID=A0AAN6XE81_9PEZI|nr:hypothetical protein QBC40DRAFT_314047 [Triangularia verruculosa]